MSMSSVTSLMRALSRSVLSACGHMFDDSIKLPVVCAGVFNLPQLFHIANKNAGKDLARLGCARMGAAWLDFCIVSALLPHGFRMEGECLGPCV